MKRKNQQHQKITFLIVLVSILFIPFLLRAQSEGCNSKLEVVNNKDSKKAGESGASYRLRLTNIGLDASIYNVKLVNDNTIVSRQSISKNNQINISGEFYNVSLKKMKSSNKVSSFSNNKGATNQNEIEIFLNGKESKTFIVKMKTPIGAKIGSINKSEVQVTSDKCKNKTISVVLNTEIIDGE
jgi:hypothetical protein